MRESYGEIIRRDDDFSCRILDGLEGRDRSQRGRDYSDQIKI